MNEQVPEWGQPVDRLRPFLRLRRGTTWYIKRKSGNIPLGKDLAEAKRRYDDELGKPVPENRAIRCSEAWDFYIDDHPLSETTRARYASVWKTWAKVTLGTKRVADVKPRDIIVVLERMQAAGRSSDNGYRALSSFFTACTKEPTRYRFDSPVSSIGKKYVPNSRSGKVSEDEILDSETVEQLAGLAAVAGNPNRFDERIGALQLATIIRLQARVGARISELLALYVSDIKDDTINIEKQLKPSFKALLPETWFKPAKGVRGEIGAENRVVDLDSIAKKALYEYIEQGVLEGWLAMDGLLFPNAMGRPRAATHIIDKVTDLHEQIGTGVTGTHCFRHTAASRWRDNGATIEEIASLLGNSPEVARTRYIREGAGDRTKLKERRSVFMDVE